MEDPGAGDAVTTANDASSGPSRSVELYSPTYYVISKDLALLPLALLAGQEAARHGVREQGGGELMARFRTIAVNMVTDAEDGSEAERLWGAAARAAREEGREPYTTLLDFVGGYAGCPALTSTPEEKLRMFKYLGKLRFGLPAKDTPH